MKSKIAIVALSLGLAFMTFVSYQQNIVILKQQFVIRLLNTLIESGCGVGPSINQ
jgi:hypothetical protein